MHVYLGDLEELGAERGFLPGGVTFTAYATYGMEAGPDHFVTLNCTG